MSVYLLATLDTKGQEAALVRDLLVEFGVETKLVDTGCVGEPSVEADVSRADVFAAAGSSLDAMREKGDRGVAVTTAAEGAAKLAAEWHASGKLSGILAIGGSAGSTIGTSAMRAVPLGVPKLMVSTLASGNVRHYVGDKDVMMLNSVVDISGLNRISRTVFTNAVRAMAGMVRFTEGQRKYDDKPLVAATMFGVTTPCVQRAREVLEQGGYEVLVFHATGAGGQAMESLVEEGLIAGVLDITTTELADELVGGVLSAGPKRLTAAARNGVPQVVSVGATDMVNFHAPETIPEKFKGRLFYEHNPTVTLMRTTSEENEQIGQMIGSRVAASKGPAALLFPMQGVSAIDHEGQPFDDPEARDKLARGLKSAIGDVEYSELDLHINDAAFAEAAANKLMQLIEQHAKSSPK